MRVIAGVNSTGLLWRVRRLNSHCSDHDGTSRSSGLSSFSPFSPSHVDRCEALANYGLYTSTSRAGNQRSGGALSALCSESLENVAVLHSGQTLAPPCTTWKATGLTLQILQKRPTAPDP